MVVGRNPNRPTKGEGRILVDVIVDSDRCPKQRKGRVGPKHVTEVSWS